MVTDTTRQGGQERRPEHDLTRFDFYVKSIWPLLANLSSSQDIPQIQVEIDELMTLTAPESIPPGFREIFAFEFHQFATNLRAAENYWKAGQYQKALDCLHEATHTICSEPLVFQMDEWGAIIRERENLRQKMNEALKRDDLAKAQQYLDTLQEKGLITNEEYEIAWSGVASRGEQRHRTARQRRLRIMGAITLGTALLLLTLVWLPRNYLGLRKLEQAESTQPTMTFMEEADGRLIPALGRMKVPGVNVSIPVLGLGTLYRVLFGARHDKVIEESYVDWANMLIAQGELDRAQALLDRAQRFLPSGTMPAKFEQVRKDLQKLLLKRETERLLEIVSLRVNSGQIDPAFEILFAAEPSIAESTMVREQISKLRRRHPEAFAGHLLKRAQTYAQVKGVTAALEYVQREGKGAEAVPLLAEQISEWERYLAEAQAMPHLETLQRMMALREYDAALAELQALPARMQDATSIQAISALVRPIVAGRRIMDASRKLAAGDLAGSQEDLIYALQVCPDDATGVELLTVVELRISRTTAAQLREAALQLSTEGRFHEARQQLSQAQALAWREGDTGTLRELDEQIAQVMAASCEQVLTDFRDRLAGARSTDDPAGALSASECAELLGLMASGRVQYSQLNELTGQISQQAAAYLAWRPQQHVSGLLEAEEFDAARSAIADWKRALENLLPGDRQQLGAQLTGWLDHAAEPYQALYAARTAVGVLDWAKADELLTSLPPDWSHPQLDQLRAKASGGLTRQRTTEELLNQADKARAADDLVTISEVLMRLEEIKPDPNPRIDALRGQFKSLSSAPVGRVTGPEASREGSWWGHIYHGAPVQRGDVLFIRREGRIIARAKVEAEAQLGSHKMRLSVLNTMGDSAVEANDEVVRVVIPEGSGGR